MCNVNGDIVQTILSPSLCVNGDSVSSPSVSENGFNVQISTSPSHIICRRGVQLNVPPNIQSIVRHPILTIWVPCSIIIIANNWPCWLAPALALTLPLAGAYFPQRLHHLFQVPVTFSAPKLMSNWSSIPEFLNLRSLPSCPLIVLGSGTDTFLPQILSKLDYHQCPLVYAVDTLFNQLLPKNMRRIFYHTRAT